MKRLALVVLLFLVPLTASAINWQFVTSTTKGEALMIATETIVYKYGMMTAVFKLTGDAGIVGAGLTVNECRNSPQTLYIDYKISDPNYPLKEYQITDDGSMLAAVRRTLCKLSEGYV